MSESEMKILVAARDYCDAAEKLTAMSRLAARGCENEDPPEVPRCSGWRPDGIMPKSAWCERCRDFDNNRLDYLTQRRLMVNALRRMRYWRSKEAGDE